MRTRSRASSPLMQKSTWLITSTPKFYRMDLMEAMQNSSSSTTSSLLPLSFRFWSCSCMAISVDLCLCSSPHILCLTPFWLSICCSLNKGITELVLRKHMSWIYLCCFSSYIVKKNVLPFLYYVTKSIIPPNFLTIILQITRPSPIPLRFT